MGSSRITGMERTAVHASISGRPLAIAVHVGSWRNVSVSEYPCMCAWTMMVGSCAHAPISSHWLDERCIIGAHVPPGVPRGHSVRATARIL